VHLCLRCAHRVWRVFTPRRAHLCLRCAHRSSRKAAEEARAALESERSRHTRARDELATALRVSQKRVAEAEEEQLRAEDEAAAARAELSALQAAGGRAQEEGGSSQQRQQQGQQRQAPGMSLEVGRANQAAAAEAAAEAARQVGVG